MRLDGTVPADNPFTTTDTARAEIWSYGHRNPQGLAVAPEGELWSHEHGPMHGDELNQIRRGANYGWPLVSWGWQYAGGPIGRGLVSAPGIERAAWVWSRAIAPSGLVWYRGNAFPGWRGSLFTGAMRGHLNRLVVRDGSIVLEERLLDGLTGRVRMVAEGPDGALYIGSDNGRLLRLRPADGDDQ
jgi:glucose/arabinose dehydrogenase